MNIELLETDQLIEELLKRFDSAIFAGSRFQPIEKGSEQCISKEIHCFDGNARVCQGLAFGVIHHINRKRDAAMDVAGEER